MTKNFTKIFTLKSLVAALLFGMSFNAQAQCDEPVPAPEGAIFSWQFDGGLEGWQTLDATLNDKEFGWAWDEEGRIDRGAYNSTFPTILSPSQCNGAVVFDSDFLDNRGVAGDFGLGDCPSVCTGILLSPVVDLSTYEGDLSLTFTQATRQFQSEYSVIVSTDGGVSFTDTVALNEELGVNSNHFLDQQITIPLCDVAGSAEVVFGFLYVGDYYYWAIDDVAIVPAQADASANSNWFVVAPSFGTPFNMTYPYPLMSDVQNRSSLPAPMPQLHVTVSDDNGNEIYTDTKQYDDIPSACAGGRAWIVENDHFENIYMPPTEIGTYDINYVMDVDGDTNTANDTVSGFFQITDREFKRVLPEVEAGTEYLRGGSFSTAYQSWGSFIYIPQNDDNQAIEVIRTGITSFDDNPMTTGFLRFVVYRWSDTNPDPDATLVDALDDLELLGENLNFLIDDSGNVQNALTGEAVANNRDFEVPITNANGEMIVPNAGDSLIVMVHTQPLTPSAQNWASLSIFEGSASYMSMTANPVSNQFGIAGLDAKYGTLAGTGSGPDDEETRGFFQVGNASFFMNMRMTPAVSSEDINTELGVNVYPTPASDIVFAELSLENISETVNVEVINFKGQTVVSKSFRNVQNDKLSIDVSTVPTGMYIMNVRTEEGMISKKFSVIR